MALKRRRTKIVATLGPASSDPAVISELIEAGVDVFRLNYSHGDHKTHGEVAGRVRSAAAELSLPVALLADLCGPKIRAGRFPDGAIELADESEVVVTTREIVGDADLIPCSYPALAGDVNEGDCILLSDGTLELRVVSVAGSEVICRVVHGGRLRDKAGINLPGVDVSSPSLTTKDRADAQHALEIGVDFLGLSFVRNASDVEDLKKLVAAAGGRAELIAKIEKPEALEDIDAIVNSADGIMVARGDLGVELPPERVPLAQSQLIDKARLHNKPVIIATEMLDSMIDRARPTRAEVSDVSNAVSSGADAVMLSAETATGAHPVLAVQMMDRVARATEGHLWEHGAFGTIRGHQPYLESTGIGGAIARAAAQLSRNLKVRAVVVISRSGHTARMMSSVRPAAPLLAVSLEAHVCRNMNLLWGTAPLRIDSAHELEDSHALASRCATDLGLASEGDNVLVVRGFNADPRLNTPSVTVLTL